MSFKRNITLKLLNDLKKDIFFKKYLKPDITNSKIFMAVRSNVIDFYYKGGRLFRYDSSGFKTHIKYASVIPKSKSDYMTEKELKSFSYSTNFQRDFERIKENCSKYAKEEALGASHIYNKYSYIHKHTQIIVLDIEISFKSQDKDDGQDRIDLLLFNKDEKKIRFVELKLYRNKELWALIGSKPKVISQINRYLKQIITPSINHEIMEAYKNYINIVNSLFSLTLPLPEIIDDKIILLICGFDDDQKKGKLANYYSSSNSGVKDLKYYAKGDIKSIDTNSIWHNIKSL